MAITKIEDRYPLRILDEAFGKSCSHKPAGKPMVRCPSVEEKLFRTIVGKEENHVFIKDWYVQSIDPYKDAGYPLDSLGNFARVTGSNMGKWINLPNVMELICTDLDLECPKLKDVMSGGRRQDLNRDTLLLSILSRIGTESYTPEWNNPETYNQLDVIESSTGLPELANKLLAQTLRSEIRKKFNRRRDGTKVNILDLGPGKGDTSLELITLMNEMADNGEIPKRSVDDVRLILYDVQKKALEETYMRFADYKGRVPGEIDAQRGNFLRIDEGRLSSYTGKIDMVISGAAVIHNTDLRSFFSSVYRLMRPRAKMHVWDWDGGPTFAAPRLRIGTPGKEDWNFRHPSRTRHIDNPYEMDTNVHDWVSKSEIDVTYGISESQAKIVLMNLLNFTDLLGYAIPDPKTGKREEQIIGGQKIRKHISRAFRKAIRGEGFSLVEYMEENLVGIEPIGLRSAYKLIEGYGDPYAPIMKRVRFEAVDIPFDKIYKTHSKENQRLPRDLGYPLITFTRAVKPLMHGISSRDYSKCMED